MSRLTFWQLLWPTPCTSCPSSEHTHIHVHQRTSSYRLIISVNAEYLFWCDASPAVSQSPSWQLVWLFRWRSPSNPEQTHTGHRLTQHTDLLLHPIIVTIAIRVILMPSALWTAKSVQAPFYHFVASEILSFILTVIRVHLNKFDVLGLQALLKQTTTDRSYFSDRMR